jgi:FlaA1/EpsC-like NDP-sugar epimerase
MGATKRLCEMMLLQAVNGNGHCYSSVRFGNVLASNGSVVPLFLDQIKRGGPVTIAHPEMRRYFMLVSEAVQLVFQAATIGVGGAIHVLDMGDQIKVVDLARSLIRLSGFIPDEEIAIVCTGPRPGEKLYEELIGDDELMQPAAIEGIFRVSPKGDFLHRSMSEISRLEEIAATDDEQATIACLQELVPTYRSSGTLSLHFGTQRAQNF